MTLPSPRVSTRSYRTFENLYDDLEPDEQDFFDFLSGELEKVQSFYKAREGDAVRRAHDLRDQLRELAEHRRVFHELYPNGMPEWEAKVGKLLPVTGKDFAGAAQKLNLRIPFVFDPDGNANGTGHGKGKDQDKSSVEDDGGMDEARKKRIREQVAADKDHQTYSPERYQKYKKELRTAVLEFYRQLELIKNYRVSSISRGFGSVMRLILVDHEFDGVPKSVEKV